MRDNFRRATTSPRSVLGATPGVGGKTCSTNPPQEEEEKRETGTRSTTNKKKYPDQKRSENANERQKRRGSSPSHGSTPIIALVCFANHHRHPREETGRAVPVPINVRRVFSNSASMDGFLSSSQKDEDSDCVANTNIKHRL